MNKDFFESQINRRRRCDQEMYQDAFSDILSILGIKGPKSIRETKGAVSKILNYLGHKVPDVPESITDLDSQLEYMLSPSGTMRRRVELVGEWWKDCMGCILASTKDGSIVSVIPGRWSGYHYYDKDGRIINVNKNTAKNLNIDGFCFYKSFPLKKLKIRDLLTFMIQSVSKLDIAMILLSLGVVQLLGMITPDIQKMIYDKVIPSGSMSFLGLVAILMIGLMAANTLVGMVRDIVTYRFRSKMNLSVNSAIMMRMFSLPTTFFKNYSSGELASRMNYIATLCQVLADAIFSTGFTAVFSFAYLFKMYQYAPTLVVPGMVAIFATVIFTILITLMQQKIYRKSMDLSPKLQAITLSMFSGIQKIKVTGAEKRAFAKWAEKYSEVEKMEYSPPMILRTSSVISTIISALSMIVVYYAAATTGVSASSYFAFFAAYGAISGAIMSLSNIALKMASLRPIIDMVKPIMEEEPESSSGRKIVTSLSGDIEVNNATFAYGDGPTILNDISLKIKKGEYVAIVGKTGCGKSTLMRLLLGFERPQKGGIYYNGKDINTLDVRSLRQKIGVVMQNGSLFPGDIFSNIIVTAPWKNMEDAWAAAEVAGMADDIRAMPMGMNTVISEGSGGISGGQKQRIMIARAVIARPSVLFFDEATSALDNITQSHVARSITSLKCTRLVIAHRLSTIRHCDRIIVLDNGSIAEEGDYQSLMDKKGKFYDLAIRQVTN